MVQDGWILQGAGVLGDGLALGQGAQQAAHDLAGTGLGQVFTKADVLGLGNRPDFFGNPVAQFFGNRFGFVAAGAGPLQHHKCANRLARQIIGAADHGSFGDQIGLGHERGLNFHGSHAVAGYVEHVINTAGDTEIATVCTAHRTVTGKVQLATHFLGEIGLFETLGIIPDGADHGRPRALDDQDATGSIGNVIANFIHDGSHDPGQGQCAATGNQRCGAGQRGHHVATGFGLPEGVHDGAFLVADVFVVPHPCFGVDGFAHRAKNAQARQVRAVRVHRGIALSRLDQRTDRSRRRVEDGALVALNHLPEATGVRESGYTLKNDLGSASSQRAIGHIGMARDPADVSRAPEHILRLQVKGPIHGELGPQQIAPCGMLHALGLAGRTRGVEDEQGVLSAHGYRCAVGTFAGKCFVKRFVAPCHHVASRFGALVHVHVLDGLAATHGNALVHDGLQRQLLAAAHLVVAGDHCHRTRIDDALLQGLGREAAEHHAVGGADTGAGLHRNHAFQGHGHVHQHTVALLDAVCLECVGKLADPCQQLFVGGFGDSTVIGLKNDRHFVFGGGADVLVQAVGGRIQLAVIKPFVKRCVGLIQSAGERLVPHHVFLGQAGPETFEIFLGFGAKGVVALHAGDAGRFDRGFTGWEHPVFNQHGLDSRR